MATGDLCSAADVGAYSGKTDTVSLALYGVLVPKASAFIAAYCGRTLASAAYVETRNGNGADRIIVRNTPLTAVTSVQVNGNVIPAAPDSVSPGWMMNPDENAIYIREGCGLGQRSSCFERGVQNIILSYTGGFASIPPDLNQACCELIAFKAAKRDRIDKGSETLAGQTVSGFDMSDMPKGVKSLLDSSYRITMVPP